MKVERETSRESTRYGREIRVRDIYALRGSLTAGAGSADLLSRCKDKSNYPDR